MTHILELIDKYKAELSNNQDLALITQDNKAKLFEQNSIPPKINFLK